MATDMFTAVEALQAAALDETAWPRALAALTETLGGVGASLEVIGRSPRRHIEMFEYNLPAAGAYIDHYAALSPRNATVMGGATGDALWDYQVIDEADIDSDPFYAELLAPADMRYFLGGVVDTSAEQVTVLGVQRSARRGHASKADILNMTRLIPHVRAAVDTNRRLRETLGRAGALEAALDWVGDGVVLLSADGAIVHANAAMRVIAERGDGVTLAQGGITFGAAAAQRDWRRGLGQVVGAGQGGMPAEAGAEFVAERADGRRYHVALRALAKVCSARDRSGPVAKAVAFIRDPHIHGSARADLRAAFGLTPAEARMAEALRSGVSPIAYARERGLTINTVYTHLRRIKDKTGGGRLTDLVVRLGAADTSARRD